MNTTKARKRVIKRHVAEQYDMFGHRPQQPKRFDAEAWTKQVGGLWNYYTQYRIS